MKEYIVADVSETLFKWSLVYCVSREESESSIYLYLF